MNAEYGMAHRFEEFDVAAFTVGAVFPGVFRTRLVQGEETDGFDWVTAAADFVDGCAPPGCALSAGGFLGGVVSCEGFTFGESVDEHEPDRFHGFLWGGGPVVFFHGCYIVLVWSSCPR